MAAAAADAKSKSALEAAQREARAREAELERASKAALARTERSWRKAVAEAEAEGARRLQAAQGDAGFELELVASGVADRRAAAQDHGKSQQNGLQLYQKSLENKAQGQFGVKDTHTLTPMLCLNCC